MDVRLDATHHLSALADDAEAAQARIASADPGAIDALLTGAAIDRARASLRLDASALDDATAAAVDAGTWRRPQEAVSLTSARAGGWAAALKLEGMATSDVVAIEYANLKAAHAAEAHLARDLFDDPMTVLGELHGIICDGLVEPDVMGRPRRTVQAIHDGAQGRVIFNPAAPEAIPGLLEALSTWLRGRARGRRLDALVTAAVVHERLLEWQPFEAANGRLARAAAATTLRALDVDPLALAIPDRAFVEQPGRYYSEVAATIRRRGDLTLWTEFHTEAVVAGLEAAAVALAAEPVVPAPARADDVTSSWTRGEMITVADYADTAGVSRDVAAAELRALAATGVVRRDVGTRGLRFVRA